MGPHRFAGPAVRRGWARGATRIGIGVAGRLGRDHRQDSRRPVETRHEIFPVLPHVGDARSPAGPYISVSHRPCGGGSGMRRARKCRRNRSQGLGARSASDPPPAGAIVSVRRRHPPVHAGIAACRPRMNIPAIGIIAAAPGSLMRTGGEGRTPGPGPFAAATADKRRRSAPSKNAIGRLGTPCPPDSAAHPLRMRPCRDAGNRAMNLPVARYRAAERRRGGRKAPEASKKRGISAACGAFRAARGRSAAPRIARDNIRFIGSELVKPFSTLAAMPSDRRTARRTADGR